MCVSADTSRLRSRRLRTTIRLHEEAGGIVGRGGGAVNCWLGELCRGHAGSGGAYGRNGGLLHTLCLYVPDVETGRLGAGQQARRTFLHPFVLATSSCSAGHRRTTPPVSRT